MSARPKKILFISHEATVSGATLVLLDLIKWLKEHADVEISVLMRVDGPLRDKFAEVGSVYIYELDQKHFHNRLSSFLYRQFIRHEQIAQHRKNLLTTLQKTGFDLIYANTMSIGEILSFLKPLKCKVITHIHELQYVIECIGLNIMRQVIENTSFFIAGCDDIKTNLTQNYGVVASKVLVLPELINFAKIDASNQASNLKEQLEIRPENFVIGGCGSVEWRKGTDLFVEVAIQVLAEIPYAKFLWICTPRQSDMLEKLIFDIKKAGLEKSIIFTGQNQNPYPYFRAFNLFLLTSREDPYPLVCIENMYLNNRVICFENTGGAVALISRYEFGRAVPYLNTASMAKAVIDFIKNPKSTLPSIDKGRLKEEHSVETVAPKIFQAILDLL